jgi:hypothetical protein
MQRIYYLFSLLAFLGWAGIASAQDGPALSLRLSRDVGAGFGSQIQGTFSFHVTGPASLERVVFLIDEQEIGEDTEAPFRLQFRTGNYAAGVHTLSAVGFTTDGRQLSSNSLRREFITGSAATRRMLAIIIPILILVVAGRAISAWIANRNRQKAGLPPIHGPLGGTICPNCAQPYAFHIWSFNLVAFRIDRCPHCGQWKIVKKYHPDLLAASAEAMMKAKERSASQTSPSPDEKVRQQLEDSRFDDKTTDNK